MRRDRRARDDAARARLPCAELEVLLAALRGTVGDLGDDPVHHPRRHHLRADPPSPARATAWCSHHRPGPDALAMIVRDDGDADLPRHLRRPGQHDDDHVADLHAGGAALGIDPVWFGVLFLICMQMGLLLPPHGLLLMTMAASPAASDDGSHLPRRRALRRDEPRVAGGGFVSRDRDVAAGVDRVAFVIPGLTRGSISSPRGPCIVRPSACTARPGRAQRIGAAAGAAPRLPAVFPIP